MSTVSGTVSSRRVSSTGALISCELAGTGISREHWSTTGRSVSVLHAAILSCNYLGVTFRGVQFEILSPFVVTWLEFLKKKREERKRHFFNCSKIEQNPEGEISCRLKMVNSHR